MILIIIFFVCILVIMIVYAFKEHDKKREIAFKKLYSSLDNLKKQSGYKELKFKKGDEVVYRTNTGIFYHKIADVLLDKYLLYTKTKGTFSSDHLFKFEEKAMLLEDYRKMCCGNLPECLKPKEIDNAK